MQEILFVIAKKIKNFVGDFVMEDKIALLEKIFPEVITEKNFDGEIKKAVDFDKLKDILQNNISDAHESYNFTWVGKNAARAEAYRKIDKTLRPCLDESKNFDTTQNIYIEGDNLEVLKLLQQSYMHKIKMIYIDPPYNTGNDFIYRDNFTMSEKNFADGVGLYDNDENLNFSANSETNPRFHSDWCSMIYSRLLLARNLLTDDGVIFISIDDNEQANLKKICDEVFGESNFRNKIIARRRVKSLNSQFAENGLYSLNVGYEEILIYAKSSDFLMKAIYQKKENVSDKGRWDVFWSNADRPTMRYDVLGFTPSTGQWRNSKEKAMIAVENYQTYVEKFADKISLEDYSKQTGIKDFIRRIPNGTGKNGGVQHWIAPSNISLRNSNWLDLEVSQIAKEINLPFDNPKNKNLILELLKLADVKSDEIVLDFFSGSGTTAHAVMQINSEDGGRRKFIMVQLAEECGENTEAYKAGYENICEIGKERIRRAGDKITADIDKGFRVFKLASSNFKEFNISPAELTQEMLWEFAENIKADRNDLDLLFGCLIKWGAELHLPCTREKFEGATIYNYNDGDLMACFDKNISFELIKYIVKKKPRRAVFRESCFTRDDEKINASEIFKMYDIKFKVI